jgi:hypothetical protein
VYKKKLALKDAKAFFRMLVDHESVIPRFSYPQSVFFLLSENNFSQAWDHWLGPGLQFKGYDVTVE